ncbi:MAG: nitroreductase family protein [Candidatus Thorarchaeota archaeon]
MSRIKFSTSILEIIQSRYSCRKYRNQLLDDKTKNHLVKILQGDHTSPFGGKTRFELLEMSELDHKEKNQLGTYGFIQGAQNFIVGAIKNSPDDLENFGYILEEIILHATDLGLGTCWVGGTFKRSRFAAQISIQNDEVVPAITPVGYADRSRSKVDRLARWVARSKRRLPWESIFFEGDYTHPLPPEKVNQYEKPLEMIRIAPSASNRQPWRIIKEKHTQTYHFFILRKKSWYSRFLSWPDFPRIDIGIAICHFNLTAHELELSGDWQLINPNLTIPSHLEYVISWISD